MMHEDEFKEIIKIYKDLRQEGVVFPKREAENQFLINFEGTKSPIFESIENNCVYEEPSKFLKPENIYAVKSDDLFGSKLSSKSSGFIQLSDKALSSGKKTSDKRFDRQELLKIDRKLFHFEELLASSTDVKEMTNPVFRDLCKQIKSFIERAKTCISLSEFTYEIEDDIKKSYLKARKLLNEYEERSEMCELNIRNELKSPEENYFLSEKIRREDEFKVNGEEENICDPLKKDFDLLDLEIVERSAVRSQSPKKPSVKTLDDFFDFIQNP